VVCIFCVLVFMAIAGAVTAATVDKVEEQLSDKAEDGEVRRTVDTESVAKFELKVKVGNKTVPVAVTVFKEHRRVRIQILSHELTTEEVEQLEDELAEALEAEIVDREHGAAGEAEHSHDEPEREREREKEKAKEKSKQKERPERS
jgi:DNA-binding protein YbaB